MGDALAVLILLGFAAWRAGQRWITPLRHAIADALDPDEPATIITSAAPDYGAALADNEPAGAMPAGQWLTLLNDEPDTVPHLAVCGPTGSGKSTLALALLTRRPGALVICTPKSAADDSWGGFPAVRLAAGPDDEPDFGPIGDAVEAVYREMNRRNVDAARPRVPVTLVVDELTSVLYELRGRDLQAKLIRLWLMGRSVRIRLITMDPTTNVKGWGIEGRGDVRESIAFVRCERDRSALIGSLEEVRTGDGHALDTSDVPALAAAGLDPARVWRYEPRAMDPAISRYDAAIAPPGADSDSGSAWAHQVREMAANGISTRRILAALGGNYNEIVRLAREAREDAHG